MAESDNSKWLEEGPQTEVTLLVEYHAKVIMADKEIEPEMFSKWGETDAMRAAYKTSFYINRCRPKIKSAEAREALFRKRTVDQILQEGFIDSTSDYAVAFRGLMIAQGVPASFLETIDANFVIGEKTHPGRAYVRVFDKEKGIIINPEKCEKINSKFKLLPHIIIGEGLDAWDLGLVLDRQGLTKYRDANLPQLLDDYERLIGMKYTYEMDKIACFRRANGFND